MGKASRTETGTPRQKVSVIK